MCNINAWFGKYNQTIKKKDLETFWGYTIDSSKSNRDGYSLWIENSIYKWDTKRIPSLLAVNKTLSRQNYIITHQRLATHGKGKEMAHPYTFNIDEHCQLKGMHNGIFHFGKQTFDEKKYSDSYIFFEGLAKALDKGLNRPNMSWNESLRLTISEHIEQNQISGSYSILMSIGNSFYYFRHNRDIKAYSHKGLWISTTPRTGLAAHAITVEEDALYLIDRSHSKLTKLGSIKPLPMYPTVGVKDLIKKYAIEVAKDWVEESRSTPDEARKLMIFISSLLKYPSLLDQIADAGIDQVSSWFSSMEEKLFYLDVEGEEEDETTITPEWVKRNNPYYDGWEKEYSHNLLTTYPLL